MSGIERTHSVLQPHRIAYVNPDGRRRGKDSRDFDLELAGLEIIPQAPAAAPAEQPAPPQSELADEDGVGARVNIVV